MEPWPRALLAALPVVTVFALVGSQRVAGWKAALAGAVVALALALAVWRQAPAAALAAAAYGVLSGLFPIVYIIFGSLLLYHLTVVTGWAERLRQGLARVVGDENLLLLLVGFGFVAFLDSTAGFLTPVAVGAALLTGLGVPALRAAAYVLVASSLPPVFGAMGIPVIVLADVSGLELSVLARGQAAAAAVVFLVFPAWLTLAFGGWAALRRLGLPCLAAGASYAGVLWWMVARVSLYPAALAASVAAMAAILLAARVTHAAPPAAPGERSAAAPWWPYGLLMACVTAWALPPVARVLGRFTVTLEMPRLPGVAWRLDLAASPGTAILAAVLLFVLMARVPRSAVLEALRLTARQLRLPLVNMLAMFALAQVMKASGMTATLGEAAAGTGKLFPLVSPYLSWLGAGIAGSNTASNALLGSLQAATARSLGLDPLLSVSLAGVASALGKMVAPQVVAAAMAGAALQGAEGRLLRTGLAHSALLTGLLGLVGLMLSG